MKPLRILLLVVLLAALGAGAFVVNRGMQSLDQPVNLGSPLVFLVQPKSSFSRVASELAARGVIREPRAWTLYARFKGLASAVKAGEYQIQPGITPRELLNKMVSGQVLLHSFTIVDGLRVQDVLEQMRHHPDIVNTLPQAGSANLGALVMEKLGERNVDAEGQFLPETYKFISGTTDLDILRQAHTALQRELANAWASRESGLPAKNPEELLIMASIIQKESGIPQELAKIAGLYWHRLAIGMRLQADPTVIYGLGERYDGIIHTVDLQSDTPYNTSTPSEPASAVRCVSRSRTQGRPSFPVSGQRHAGTRPTSVRRQCRSPAPAPSSGMPAPTPPCPARGWRLPLAA